MREIKFRAITTNANVNHFVYGLPVKAVKTGIWLMQIIEGEFGWLKTEGIDPETIGQFTGLLDKNGKEVYEGDICRIKFDIAKVEGYIYNSLTKKELESGERIFIVESPLFNNQQELNVDDIEVIGNIHESK